MIETTSNIKIIPRLGGKKKNTINPYSKSAFIRKLYNKQTWQKLRRCKLMENPMCEVCNKNLAEQVHHKIEISSGVDEQSIMELAYSYENLQSICLECHKAVHK